jgi:hypothetical protein
MNRQAVVVDSVDPCGRIALQSWRTTSSIAAALDAASLSARDGENSMTSSRAT